MTTPKFLALIANQIESLAGFNSSANQTDAGYWERIALAAEQIAGASTAANSTELGYMKRATAAICTACNFSSVLFNTNENGYLAKIIAALAAFQSVTPNSVSSLEKQLYDLLTTWTPGGGGPLAPTYDTRFGTATDTNGWITFGLNAGNRRVWVDSVNGNDTNNGLSAATAKATLVAAGAVLKGAGSAAGDQIMVAGGQGQTYTYVGQNDSVFNHIPGISATYPTAMLCYDSTDPSNSAKYGKLLGSNQPKIVTDAGYGGYSFWDIASDQGGFGNLAVQGVHIVGSTNVFGYQPDNLGINYVGRHNNICYQNCRFDGLGISYNCNPGNTSLGTASVGLISKCSFWGMWDSDRGDNQALYAQGWDQLKIQNCTGAHCGYRLGASRDDSTADGGAAQYGHFLYLHPSPDVTVDVDRCFSIDSEVDDWGLRANGAVTQFVAIDQASGQALTGFSGSYTENPTGSVSTATDFICAGGQNINTSQQTYGGGVSTANTATSGCSVTNGYLFDNPYKASSPLISVTAYGGTQVNQFLAVSNLRVWNYATSTSLNLWPSTNSTSATLSNCLLDTLANKISGTFQSPLGGTNRLWTAGDYPAPITKNDLITQLGFSSKAALVNAVLAFPHLPWAQAALGLAQTAFGGTLTYQTAAVPSLTGLPTPEIVYKTTLSDLTLSASFVRGPFPAITAMTVSGTTCTVTTASAHGMSTGMLVKIAGATPSAYNTGATPITVLNSTQFTYIKRSAPGGAATVMGSYTQAAALLGAGGNSTFASAGASGTGASDLPAGITLAGSTLFYDGTGSGPFPTFHITETNTDGAGMHTTTFFPAASWTPASLSGVNIWATPDAAYSFTDLGTTNVSADGQQVEQVNDRSGHGFNLTQTVAVDRPTWFSNSGKPYWQYTAASPSYMATASGLTMVDASGQSYIALAVSFDAVASSQIAAAIEGTTSATRMLWVKNTTGGQGFTQSFDSTGAAQSDTGNAITVGTPCVLIVTATTTSLEIFVDNASTGGTTLSTAREISTGRLVLGESLVNGGPFGGKIFGVVQGTGTLSSTDRANLQTYMAGLHP